MTDTTIHLATLDPEGDWFQPLRRELGGAGEHESRDARAWTSWDEEGEGRSLQEVPLPDDLP
ncbi:MAG: hypothetical protein QOI84_792 [Solirubrobacterales bacterium]|jgi:hypothetical protein|nr:hypothetical protein [Solirubrobacterales bacterium]